MINNDIPLERFRVFRKCLVQCPVNILACFQFFVFLIKIITYAIVFFSITCCICLMAAGGSRTRGGLTKTWHKTCNKDLSEMDINWNEVKEYAMIKVCRLMLQKTVLR